MNTTITFRHMDPSDALKAYAIEKVGKLQKFLRQPMSAKVTLSVDKLVHCVEVQVSSGGAHLEAKDRGEDTYASIDKVADKLERQIRGAKGQEQAKTRRSGASLRGAPEPPPIGAAGLEEQDVVLDEETVLDEGAYGPEAAPPADGPLAPAGEQVLAVG